MILEQFVTDAAIRLKLRNGPLANLIDGFCVWLQHNGFSHFTICKHLLNISRFNDYLSKKDKSPLKIITSEQVNDFLESPFLPYRSRRDARCHSQELEYSINRFIKYLESNHCFICMSQPPFYQPLLDDYLSWLHLHLHSSSGTITLRRTSIIRFLKWLGPRAMPAALATLTSSEVETFFLSHSKDLGQPGRRSLQAALRTFLRFCFQKGLIVLSLDKAVPTLRTYKLSTVPRAISDEQAQTLLDSIDKQTSVGKRDHAIVMLLYTYGVRCGQVAALQLQDIHWAEAQITFKASKYGKETLLPLTEEVGNSLFNYIKQARPSNAHPEVFLTTRAPYRSLCHSSAISEVVRRYIIKVGFDLPTKGAHIFRHCFAGRMVQQGHSLKAVADMLGHCCLSTTFIYTKVDFNTLQQVALPWPQEV